MQHAQEGHSIQFLNPIESDKKMPKTLSECIEVENQKDTKETLSP